MMFESSDTRSFRTRLKRGFLMKLRCNLTKGESYEVGICDKNGGGMNEAIKVCFGVALKELCLTGNSLDVNLDNKAHWVFNRLSQSFLVPFA